MENMSRKVQKVAIEPYFTFPVGNDWRFMGFLDFAGKVGFSNPSRAVAQLVCELYLVQKIPKHEGFTGRVPVHRSLTDRKEDVVFH
jgi:hypothetical protein